MHTTSAIHESLLFGEVVGMVRTLAIDIGAANGLA
jgi:hypothetical protein